MTKRKLSIEEKNEIANIYGSITAQEISDMYKCSINQVYGVAKSRNLTRKQNKVVEITERMNQILLSGIIGDGRFKKNGKYNVCYSECHGETEYGYLEWKFKELEGLTRESSIYYKNANNGHSIAKEFTTLTTPSLIKYHSMVDKVEIINQLNELGLLLHLLDDGAFQPYTCGKNGRFTICTYSWEDNERIALANRWENLTGISFKEYGVKRVELGASSSENKMILDLALKYFDKDLDIIQKKFGIIMKNV